MSDFIDDLPIQRCIDGELSEAAQQELLWQLDDSADGWKRLALAFVEKQVWSQACENLSAPTATAAIARPASSRRSVVTQSRWFMTASLLLSLASGIVAGMWLTSKPNGQDSIAPSETMNRSVFPGPAQPSQPAVVSSDKAIAANTVSVRPAVLELPLTSESDVPQSVQIPVFDAQSAPRQTRQERLLTEAEVESLRRSGYQVDRQRKLLAVPVKGGADVIVPVESYGIRYAVQ